MRAGRRGKPGLRHRAAAPSVGGASRLTGIQAQREGRHVFEDLARENIELEIVRTLKAPRVIHVRYRVREK